MKTVWNGMCVVQCTLYSLQLCILANTVCTFSKMSGNFPGTKIFFNGGLRDRGESALAMDQTQKVLIAIFENLPHLLQVSRTVFSKLSKMVSIVSVVKNYQNCHKLSSKIVINYHQKLYLRIVIKN